MAPELPLTTTSPVPTARSTRRPLLVVVAVVASLVAVAVALRLLVAPAPTRLAGVSWPTAGPGSPTTPANDRPWPGTVPPPSMVVGAPGNASAPPEGPTGPAQPTGAANDGLFCTSARIELVSLGSQGLSTLKGLATEAGDAVPQARGVVESAVAQAGRLQGAAPAELVQAVETLASAWSTLSAALDRAGYDRGAVIGLAIKYLTNPVVAAAWGAITVWVARHCGVTLVESRPTGS
ncbi:MAG TPA: hypothetical protein VI248_23750 [Kineosporiaceae bacterium]